MATKNESSNTSAGEGAVYNPELPGGNPSLPGWVVPAIGVAVVVIGVALILAFR